VLPEDTILMGTDRSSGELAVTLAPDNGESTGGKSFARAYLRIWHGHAPFSDYQNRRWHRPLARGSKASETQHRREARATLEDDSPRGTRTFRLLI